MIKKKKLKKVGIKLIICLIVLLMLSTYFPMVSTIVEATSSTINQIANTNNQVIPNVKEKKDEGASFEQPNVETNEIKTTQKQVETETKSTDNEVDIKDYKLKEYLLNKHDTNGDKTITESEMLQITSFTCDSSIKDLSGLEYAKNIENLYLYNNQYENMNAVYELPKLKDLTLYYNNVKNLANFVSANKLEVLRIYNYNSTDNVVDYNYIAGLTSLKELEIVDNSLKTTFSISTLSKLTNLEKLRLSLNNQKIDISSIGSLKNLTNLNLSDNYIEDISPVKELKNLEVLNIKTIDSQNNIDTLNALNIRSLNYHQDIADKIYIEKGKKTEIDTPIVMEKMTDKNSPIYSENISIASELISFNNEKTKIILDGTNAELGNGNTYINGNYSYYDENTFTSKNINVSLKINYVVHEVVENKEEVNIPDGELKRYLLKEYDIDGDKKITNYDMLQIRSFNILNEYNIKNLTGLETAQNITELSLNSNYDDISAVNKLKNVTSLTLSNNVTGIISKLTIMNNLTSLYIYNYNEQEIDFAYLGTLKNLKNLNISDTSRKNNININDLKNLINLQSLYITTKVNIDNLETLQDLKALTSLAIHTEDKLEDIGFISNLTELTFLDLSDNIISNIKPLRQLTKLSNLNLMKNPINTKESETAQTLKTLRDNGTYINVLETNQTTNIEFKDEKFKEILIKNNNADLNKDNQISIDEMEKLYNIYIYNNNSNAENLSIKEIEYATNLDYLSISSKIEDLTPITKLSKLKRLSISNNFLSDENLKTIANLTNLEYLSINISDSMNDLEIFKNMKNLKELYISNYRYTEGNKQKIFDLKGIENLTNLNNVSISGSVNNINLLKKLTKLQTLQVSEKLYKDSGEQLTEKEIIDFLKSLKVKDIRFQGNTTTDVKLGNILVGSNQKLNLANVDNELIKLAFTPGSMFYSEYTKVSYYENNINKEEHPITLNTSEIGEKYLNVYISSDKFHCSLNLRWKNYVQADTAKEINIPDENLKKILLENHDIDNDKKITQQDMVNIQWLDAYNAKISSLEGLQYAKNLQYIGLTGNYIKDISPILEINTIESIDLNNNLLTDITPLKNVKWDSLYYINLNNNFIDFKKNNENYNILKNIMKESQGEYYNWEDEFTITINTQHENIEELDSEVVLEDNLKARLIRLGIDANKDNKITRREMYYAEGNYSKDMYERMEFNLSNANITNISGLEYLGFSEITHINLSDNNIEDITPITKNKNIWSINLANNNISNISGIENAYNLYDIDLSNNKITNINSLTNLFKMKNNTEWREVYINLANNEISNIDCIKNWKNLRYLDLSGNKITNIKELKNYNFKLSEQMDEQAIKEMAQYLTIDLSGNNINMTKTENKQAKELFDNIGATLKLVDKTKTTEYVLNKEGYYSSDSNLGMVSTELSSEGQYEFVPENDRTYYPDGSDTKLAGIFVNTKYYDSDKEHKEELTANGFDTEIIITGAVKTENELDGTQYLIFTLKLPDEYVGAGADMQTADCSISKTTRNTLELKIMLNLNENDKKYATINASIRLKAKECSIKVSDSNEEIINAIQNEQNVIVDMKEKITDVEPEVFKSLANKENVDLKVQTSNAVWKFNSNDIIDPNIKVNSKVTIANNKFENMDKPPFEDAIYLKFDHEGKLPGKAEIELDISNNNIYEKGKTVYLYYYDSTKKEYQYLNALTVDDKKITITLEHCSEYVISDKLLALDIGEDNNGGETTNPSEKPEINDNNNTNSNTNNLNKPHNPNKPNTGDNSNITFWITLMVISIVGIVYITLNNKKEKNKKRFTLIKK